MINYQEYGRALFLVAEERGTLKSIYEDAEALSRVLKENPAYTRLMDTPALPTEEKCALIDRAFGSLDADLVNFVKILTERRSFYLFERALTTYRALYDERLGILPVEVVSAVALTQAQASALSAKLSAKTGKRIRLTNTTDPSVLGGLLLRYDGKQIDGTLAVRLEKLSEALSNIIV